MQQLQEEIKQNEESQTLKKKEAHPVDAKSSTNLKELEKSKKTRFSKNSQGSNL
jgi:hypothetical protein